jgi:RES domain-containing protein
MRLYRLSTAAYAERLDGMGAAIRGARWNPPMVPMIYTAANRSLAVLEVLAHFGERNLFPEDTVMVTYGLHGRSGFKRPGIQALPPGWNAPGPPYPAASQAFGAAFIASPSIVMRVPSVVVKSDWNYLLNPRTLRRQVRIESVEPFRMDERLAGLLRRT